MRDGARAIAGQGEAPPDPDGGAGRQAGHPGLEPAGTRGADALRGERPGDHFNRALGLDGYLDFMLGHGWGYAWTEDDGPYKGEHYIRRPGKDSGSSATLGNPLHEGLYPKLHVFTTGAAPFEAGEAYDAFGAFALLHHDGDISAAARTLRAQGYGWDERRRLLRLGMLGESKQQRGPDDETETFHCLLRVIRDQWLPGVYHHGGQLVEAQPGHGGRIGTTLAASASTSTSGAASASNLPAQLSTQVVTNCVS